MYTNRGNLTSFKFLYYYSISGAEYFPGQLLLEFVASLVQVFEIARNKSYNSIIIQSKAT